MLFPFAAVVTALHALTSTPVYSIVGNTLGCAPYECAVHLTVPSAISDTFVPFATSLSQKLFGWPAPIKSPDPPEWPTPSKTVYYSLATSGELVALSDEQLAPLLLASPIWSPTLSALAPMPRHAVIKQGLFDYIDEGSVLANKQGCGAPAHAQEIDKDRQRSSLGTMSAAVIDSYGFALVAQMHHQLMGRIEMWAGAISVALVDRNASFGPYFRLAGALVTDLRNVIGKALVAASRAWQAGVDGILSSKDMMDDRWSEVILWSTTPSALIRMKEVSAIALVIFMVSLGSSVFSPKKWKYRFIALTNNVEEMGYDAFEVSIDEHAFISEQAGEFILDPTMVPLPIAEENELAVAPEDVPLPEDDNFSLIFGEDDSELTVTEKNGVCNVKYTEAVIVFLEPSILSTPAIDPANVPLPEDDDSWLISSDDEHSVEEQKKTRSLNGLEVINVSIPASVTANADDETCDDWLEGIYESHATVAESDTGIDPASIPLPEDDDDGELLEMPSGGRPVIAEMIRFDPANIPLPAEVDDELAEVSLQAANREYDLSTWDVPAVFLAQGEVVPCTGIADCSVAMDRLALVSEVVDISFGVVVQEVARIDGVVSPIIAINDWFRDYDDENEHTMLCNDLEVPGSAEPAGQCSRDPAMVPLPPAEENEFREVVHPLERGLAQMEVRDLRPREALHPLAPAPEEPRSEGKYVSNLFVEVDLTSNGEKNEASSFEDTEVILASFEPSILTAIEIDPANVPLPASVDVSLLEEADKGQAMVPEIGLGGVDPASIPLPDDDDDLIELPSDGRSVIAETICFDPAMLSMQLALPPGAANLSIGFNVQEVTRIGEAVSPTEAVGDGLRAYDDIDGDEHAVLCDVVPPIVDGLHASEDEDEHPMLMPFPSVALNSLRERESMMFTDVEGDEEVTSDTHYRSVIAAHMIPYLFLDLVGRDPFHGMSIARSAPSLVDYGVGADEVDAVGLDLESCEPVDDIPNVGSPLDGPAFPGPSLLSESAPSVFDTQDVAPLVSIRRRRRKRVGSLRQIYASFI